MRKALPVAALIAALAAGIGVAMVWREDSEDLGRRLSVADVERRMSNLPLGIPFAPRSSRVDATSASCVARGELQYSCTVRFRPRDDSGAPLVFYDFVVPAYEESAETQETTLRRTLAFGYRLYCHGTPPEFDTRCDAASCEYRLARSGPWIDSGKPPSKSDC